MKFILTFDWKPNTQTRTEAIERFRKTGGLPPKAVKLIGRWTRADLSGGYDLLETDDLTALAEFSMMWSDLMDNTVVPVLEDKHLNDLFKRAEQR
jgi:hypothetical protein